MKVGKIDLTWVLEAFKNQPLQGNRNNIKNCNSVHFSRNKDTDLKPHIERVHFVPENINPGKPTSKQIVKFLDFKEKKISHRYLSKMILWRTGDIKLDYHQKILTATL